MDLAFERKHGWPALPVAGIDEAGRGPWAGPVVAAAVCLPDGFSLDGDFAALNDSKKLTPGKRDALFDLLQHVPHGIGHASVEEIDTVNILQATFLAMQRAVAALPQTPHHILVDGNKLPDLPAPATAVIGGDAQAASIAAASVLAKVTRDLIMIALDAEFPGYGWAGNKGYGAKAHQAGLAAQGITPHHRKSYAPIRKIIHNM